MRPAARWGAAVLVLLTACTSTAGDVASRSPGPAVSSATIDPTERPPTSPTPVVETTTACESFTLIGAVRGSSVTARRRPSGSGSVVARFPARNDQGAEQVFPLLEEHEEAGRTWYEALLPIRPNGSTGWIDGSGLALRRSDYRLEIDTRRLRLTVYRVCDRVASYPIGIGTSDTPTPHGTFYLNSLLRPPRGSIYGKYAYGLSAYSNVIRNWTGGGIVGIHGTNDPSSIGRRVSHGCIRLRNEDITRLARELPLGTIVNIR